MQTLLLVAGGGATGAVLRYLVGVQAVRTLGHGWPYGTLAVNVLGGLLMGVLVGALAFRGGAPCSLGESPSQSIHFLEPTGG